MEWLSSWYFVLTFSKLVDIPEYHESVDEQHAVLVYRSIDDEVK